MQKLIYIKEVRQDDSTHFIGYTCLTDALRSENILRLYHVVRHQMRKNKYSEIFSYKNIIIRRIELNYGHK